MMLEPTLENDFVLDEPFLLESGEILPTLKLRFAIYGKLNERRDNAVLVFHALTGSARISDWWSGVIGAGKALDTSRFCFVCANSLGSCYGSTNASEIKTIVTTRDIVRSQIKLAEALEIENFYAAIGGSVGGMLALQLAADFSHRVDHCIAVGATPLSAMGLALNHLQREAIKHENGVALARQIAMISYKSKELFDVRFARRPNRNGENPSRSLSARFDIAGYLDYQGAKLIERFDLASYNALSKAMDLFDLSVEEISRVTTKISLVGISTDWLFPATDVQDLTKKMQNLGVDASYFEIVSDDGHDAFLSDAIKTNEVLKQVLSERRDGIRSLEL